MKLKPYKNSIEQDYEMDEYYLALGDGTEVHFDHNQECCENVYADLAQLIDTGFESDRSLHFNNLHFEFVEGYGVCLNGYGIPCYNIQNGYYSSAINIRIIHPFKTDDYGRSVIQ